MRKLLSALILTLLVIGNALADDNTSASEPPSETSAWVEVIIVVAIAIPNLLKSRPA